MAKSNEPFWWALFGAGGMVAALFVPITIIVTAILMPTRTVSRPFDVLDNLLVRLYLFVVISLPLFHWAHRFRFTLIDLGVKTARLPIAVACYGSAFVGTVLAALLALKVWP
jgi:fumarate reductase subunit D